MSVDAELNADDPIAVFAEDGDGDGDGGLSGSSHQVLVRFRWVSVVRIDRVGRAW